MRKLLLYFSTTILLVCALGAIVITNQQATANEQAVPSLPALTTAEPTPVASVTQPLTGEQIKWQVISSGGTNGSSTSFKLQGTVSQTAVGPGTSTNFKLNAGFWQDFGGATPCDCIPGDANNSKNHNILDVSYLIGYLYRGGPAPTPYAKCSGDANCNCGINILDVSYLINYLYRGGGAPCTCSQWVGNCGPLQK